MTIKVGKAFRRAFLYLLFSSFIFFLACDKEKTQIESLATGLASAIIANDEAAYLSRHVQPNDQSPSGAYWIVTRAGGARPDATWDGEIRTSLQRLRGDIERLKGDPSRLAFAEFANDKIETVDGDPDRSNLYNLQIRLKDGSQSFLITYPEAKNTKRGWVITGDLSAVTVIRE